jgi:anti-sigma28 factor (negative regulator of flagellin synthesis)
MGEIRPIERLPDVVETQRTSPRERERTERASERDEVEISPQARQAAEIARLVEMTRSLPDVREEEVERARADVEAGRYRDLGVIRDTARRLLGG